MSNFIDYLQGSEHERLYAAQLAVMGDLKRFAERGNAGYIELPTGSGKTVLFTELIKATDVKTLVLVPTQQLVEQTIEELNSNGIETRSVNISNPETSRHVSVATYAGFVKYHRSGYGGRYINPADYGLVVLDEGHHGLAEGATEALQPFKHAFQVGFTATPDYSEDRKLEQLLPTPIHRLSIGEAIDWGLVSSFSNILMKTNVDLSDVSITTSGDYDSRELDVAINTELRNRTIAQFYAANLADKKAIFSCGGVDHAINMAACLREAGVQAAAIYGGMANGEQRILRDALAKGELTALVNDKLLSEGFDDPSISVAVNVSPTMSQVRQQQRSGRALRNYAPDPGKHALIIDCIDVNYTKPPIIFADPRIASRARIQRGQNGTLPSLLERLSMARSDGVELIIDDSQVEEFARNAFERRGLRRIGKKQKEEDNSEKQMREQKRRKYINDYVHKGSEGVPQPVLAGVSFEKQPWYDQGLCAQTDPDAFFPEKGGSTREAKKICSGCEVKGECLEYALLNIERFGIWGGLSERERRRVYRSAEASAKAH